MKADSVIASIGVMAINNLGGTKAIKNLFDCVKNFMTVSISSIGLAADKSDETRELRSKH